MRPTTIRPMPAPTAAILVDLGFLDEGGRSYKHPRLPETAALDLSATADEFVVPVAVAWIRDACFEQGRRQFRKDLLDILGMRP